MSCEDGIGWDRIGKRMGDCMYSGGGGVGDGYSCQMLALASIEPSIHLSLLYLP